MIPIEIIFLKNDFPKTILRRKPFYTETNGALLSIFYESYQNKIIFFGVIICPYSRSRLKYCIK